MKYLTITIPSYNSEQYLERCLDSLILPRGWMEHVEIIVVNDGSTDRTGEIADDYVRRFPDTVRVVHKENGGHGSGVNAGLSLATGRYFKVLDSDDWFDEGAYRKLIERLEDWCIRESRGEEEVCPDLLICNYTYNHLDEGTKKTMRYGNVFPEGEITGWDDMGTFRPSQYMIMHALIYRTEVLRSSGTVLPEHTFYVDNIFAYQPLPYVETICYLNLDLYQYYIGREDQSVNEQMMIRRIEQQIRVTKIVAECVDLNEVRRVHPKLAGYMCRNISIMMAISSIHLLLKGDEEAKIRYAMLWEEIKEQDPGLYWRLRFTKLCGLTNLPGKLGKRATIDGYRLARRIYKFQ